VVDYKSHSWGEHEDIVEFKFKDKYKIKTFHYPAQGSAKGKIFFNHGFGDRGGKYAFLARKFAENGFDFFTFDNASFGQSEGPNRFIVDDIYDLVNQDLEFIRLVEEKYGSSPNFVMGHSMGGLETHLLQKEIPDQIKACVYICPGFDIHPRLKIQMDKVPKVVEWLGYYFPQIPVRGLDPKPKHSEHFFLDEHTN
jgi:alpha-beta hydrolase superfamily lysophospholipase